MKATAITRQTNATPKALPNTRKPLPKEIVENGIRYTLQGDYYFPDFERPEETRPLGKWARRHEQYLRENNLPLYTKLLFSGDLHTYLADLDEQADRRMEIIMADLKRQRHITEKLKAHDSWLWVQMMYGAQHDAEEVILHELIYA